MSRRTKLAEALPWVTHLKYPRKCDSYVNPPLSLYFSGEARRNTKYQTLEEYRCKNSARWSYRGLKNRRTYTQSGNYCWSHLVSQLSSMEEVDRQEKWFKKHPEVWYLRRVGRRASQV